MDNLQSDLINLSEEVSKLLDNKIHDLDEYDIKALFFIINYLNELHHECHTGRLKPKNQRFGYLARLITDRDTSLISFDLGSRLIKVEQRYMEYL